MQTSLSLTAARVSAQQATASKERPCLTVQMMVRRGRNAQDGYAAADFPGLPGTASSHVQATGSMSAPTLPAGGVSEGLKQANKACCCLSGCLCLLTWSCNESNRAPVENLIAPSTTGLETHEIGLQTPKDATSVPA